MEENKKELLEEKELPVNETAESKETAETTEIPEIVEDEEVKRFKELSDEEKEAEIKKMEEELEKHSEDFKAVDEAVEMLESFKDGSYVNKAVESDPEFKSRLDESGLDTDDLQKFMNKDVNSSYLVDKILKHRLSKLFESTDDKDVLVKNTFFDNKDGKYKLKPEYLKEGLVYEYYTKFPGIDDHEVIEKAIYREPDMTKITEKLNELPNFNHDDVENIIEMMSVYGNDERVKFISENLPKADRTMEKALLEKYDILEETIKELQDVKNIKDMTSKYSYHKERLNKTLLKLGKGYDDSVNSIPDLLYTILDAIQFDNDDTDEENNLRTMKIKYTIISYFRRVLTRENFIYFTLFLSQISTWITDLQQSMKDNKYEPEDPKQYRVASNWLFYILNRYMN